MHVVIDLIGGDNLVITTTEKKTSEEKKEVKSEKVVRKQIININGEIVTV